MLKFIAEKCPFGDSKLITSETFSEAAKHDEMLILLAKLQPKFCSIASFEILQLLSKKAPDLIKASVNTNALAKAAKENNFEMLKFLSQLAPESFIKAIDPSVLNSAASHGNRHLA